MTQRLVGIFDIFDNAERAAHLMKEYNLKTDDISIMSLKDEESVEDDNLADGTVTGGALGGLAGLVIGMGTVALPGVGVIAAIGPVSGLLAGALTGGVIGSLVDLGIPEDASSTYENDIKQGGVLFSMSVDEDTGGRAAQILRQCGAHKVEIHR